MNLLSTVATFMREGGPFMYLILGVAVLIVAICVERAIVLARAGRLDDAQLAERVCQAARRGHPAEAHALVSRGGGPFVVVGRALLERPLAADRAQRERDLEGAFGAAASVALAPLNRRLAYLMTLANVATLLGLLGTIFGLTHAFSAVGQADPAQRSAFLAAGISQAMNTTAFGLIVAIPTMALHAWFVGQLDGIADRLEAMAHRMIQGLSAGPAAAQPEVRRAAVQGR